MEAPESAAVISPPGEVTELPEGAAAGSSFLVGEEKVGKMGKSPPSLCSERKLWFESESEDMAAHFSSKRPLPYHMLRYVFSKNAKISLEARKI